MPLVVVPSPQLMVAVKADAVSLVLVSVNVATVVVPGSATPSVAAVRLTWPASCGVMGAMGAVVPSRNCAPKPDPLALVVRLKLKSMTWFGPLGSVPRSRASLVKNAWAAPVS